MVGKLHIVKRALEQIAKNAPKVFVPRKRHERSRIRYHADESRQQSGVREGVEMPLDALLLIEKPPRAAELNLSRYRTFLKTADRRRKSIVVRGIEIIDDGLGKGVLLVKFVKKRTKRLYLIPVPDAVKPFVCPQFTPTPRVDVSHRTQVQLFGPAFFSIQPAQE